MPAFNKKTKQDGFTLVEIAIVLMIIGLLIGGILRGQELITSARVRNIIDQKSAIQTAYIGFIDRYRMLPGDLTAAQAGIIGNGIAGGWWGGDGIVPIGNDSPWFFQNLTAAGFISCGVCTYTGTATIPHTIDNSPVNVLGGVVVFGWAPGQINPGQNTFYNPAANVPVRHILSTGANIPSQMLAEVDRKADDNFPGLGSFRYSNVDGNSGLASCVAAAVAPSPNPTWANPSSTNCEGAWLF
jgi:prepilin-type N-terminal cleavage/methylation domain-containing protein